MSTSQLSLLQAGTAPPDEAARETIRGVDGFTSPIAGDAHIILNRNLVVRAGAGSGKTRSLVDRMVALVRSGVPARELAAITFTIKAAGELRERFAASLSKARGLIEARVEETGLEDWRLELGRVERAQRALEHVFIGTVHAFCGRLLRERPFEAGLSPDFSHVDPGLVMAHRRRFWNGFVSRAADRWLARFEAVDLNPDDLFDFFSDCANNEDVLLDGLTLRPPMPDLRPAFSTVQALIDEIVERAAQAQEEDALLKEVRALHRHLQRDVDGSPASLARVLHHARRLGSRGCVLSRWGARGSAIYAYAKEIRDSISGFVEREVEPALAEWRDYVFFDAGQFVQEAVSEYSASRRRRGEQTFDDLLWGARRMLEKSPDNRAHFARKFSHILVDEFQDTDPVQAEILLLLTSTNREESNAWKCRPAEGALFIVGDDKQSIYRFRRADVDVFHRFESVLLDGGGEAVALTTNFRSEPRVCAFVNAALMPAFSDPLAPPGQARWEDLVAYPGNTARSHPEPIVRIAIPEKTHKRRTDMVREEAPRVAAAISHLVRGGHLPLEDGRLMALEGPVDFKDVMVLFRTATYMPRFVHALNGLDIPYAISGGKTLGKVESLKLLLDPLDAVLRQDSVAQLAFLRGPFCGVSDTDLMAYVEAGGSLRMPARPDGMVEPSPALADGLAMIRDLQTRLTGGPDPDEEGRRVAAEAPADAIDGWVQDHGLLAALALRPGGAGLAGSLIRILALVHTWDARGMTWPEVVEELHRLQDEDIEAEQLTLDALDGNAVQLMTVHQAKGLEAKVVILADPFWGRTPDNDIYVDRSGRDASLAGQIKNKRGDIIAWTPRWKERTVRDMELQEAEELRLAYVAATRAEELLLISFQSKVEGPWDPFARAIWEAPAYAAESAPWSAEDSEADLDAIAAAVEARAELRARLQEPTYLERIASEDTEPEAFFKVLGETRGRSYGNLVHALFESLVRNREKPLERAWVERVAARHAADAIETAERADRTRDAVKAAGVFTTSAVWEALTTADEVHAELPYTFVDRSAGAETVSTGKIDLAYRIGTTWHVVDYKTDPIAREDLVLKHGHQVREYARALRRLAGASDIRAGIWSTHSGTLVPVPEEVPSE